MRKQLGDGQESCKFYSFNDLDNADRRAAFERRLRARGHADKARQRSTDDAQEHEISAVIKASRMLLFVLACSATAVIGLVAIAVIMSISEILR